MTGAITRPDGAGEADGLTGWPARVGGFPGRQRRVEFIMGTAISVDVRDAGIPAATIDAAFAHFRDVDARFSTFRPDSEISRLGRGEIAPAECSPDVRKVLELCEEARCRTDGYFDAHRFRIGGVLDPSGLVKGWSVVGAARILEDAGARHFCINAGGDIVARGEAEPGRPWRVGIRHPLQGDRLAAVVLARDLAVATSGTYERGEHVLDPHTGRPPTGVLSVTITGPDLTFADASATAVFAMGTHGIRWAATGLPGYAACAITVERRLVCTPEFERLMERS
jgi:FAD:protein FMN transferase